MDELSLLVDLHRDGERQGPGGDEQTRLAIALSGLKPRSGLRIADIGCGTGACALVLAAELDAAVTAVDQLPEFLRELTARAQRRGLADRLEPQVGAMEQLPFAEGSLDSIWSEGAIYNMGFARGIRAWRRFLRPEGILAVSELTWLSQERPAELEQHWLRAYPEVDTASAKLRVLEQNGFSPLGYFVLPQQCWLDNYYRPMEGRFEKFLARHGQDTRALAIVAAARQEIELYERHGACFGYGYYVARRTGD